VALCGRLGTLSKRTTAGAPSALVAAELAAGSAASEDAEEEAAADAEARGADGAADGASEDAVIGAAAEALANIARHDASRPRLVLEGALEPLVAVCKRGFDGVGTMAASGGASGGATGAAPAAAATYDGDEDDGGGGAPSVGGGGGGAAAATTAAARQLPLRQRSTLLRFAAGAIANMACHAPSRSAVINAGVAAPLVALCAQGAAAASRSAGMGDADAYGWAQLLGNTAGALSNLALLPSARGALARAGAVGPLIALVGHSSDDRVLGCAAGAIANLAAERADGGAIRASLTAAGSSGGGGAGGGSAVRPLVQLLSRSKDRVVLGNAAEALANLAGAAGDGGANDGGDAPAEAAAASAAGAADSSADGVITVIVAEGAAGALVQILSHLSDARVLAAACRLLTALGRSGA
jgi:hypothetical protein